MSPCLRFDQWQKTNKEIQKSHIVRTMIKYHTTYSPTLDYDIITLIKHVLKYMFVSRC